MAFFYLLNMGFYQNILLLGIVISTVLTILGRYSLPNWVHYLFKPLTTMLVIGLVLISGNTQTTFASLVIAGLIFSLFGDIFLMLPSDKFIQGLSSFFLAHILLITAFIQMGIMISWPLTIFLFMGAVLFYAFVYRNLGSMKIPVALYILVLCMMSWSAWGVYLKFDETRFLLAGVGTISFLVSDSTLGLDRFFKKFRAAELIILLTYFVAITLIALSV